MKAFALGVLPGREIFEALTEVVLSYAAMRIAVIGGGISGIAAARVLRRSSHEVVVFERSAMLGGVWAVAYPQVRLQNIAEHYRVSDFPWPFPPDLHPTREQILRYMQALVNDCGLDLRLQHEVVSLHEKKDGWQVEIQTAQSRTSEHFDFVVVAVGQYTGEQHRLALADREQFRGRVITDRDVHDLADLDSRQVAVVGFGKSAIDMATFAAERGAQVHHVFRAPRWLIPQYIFGIHSSHLLFCRMSTAFIPCWVQPTAAERWLHARRRLVAGFWSMIGTVMQMQHGLHGLQRDPEVRRRFRLLKPDNPAPYEMRSASALAPPRYFPLVAQGRIEPYRGEVVGFTRQALRLRDGRELPCDLVVLSTGFTSPRFPFLPASYRDLAEREPDGFQLYRHLLHPRIPRMAFAGYNHGFLHLPGVEISMLWLGAFLRGDLVLPSASEMETCIEAIRSWKREHILFEPSRGCAVSTRFHQYADILLADLGLRPYRKKDPVRELLSAYSARDYDGLYDEYERIRGTLKLPRRPLPLST